MTLETAASISGTAAITQTNSFLEAQRTDNLVIIAAVRELDLLELVMET